jgi:uronate dehydrogenase
VLFHRVLLTGAAGQLGSSLRPRLRADLEELRLNDLAAVDAKHDVETVIAGDLRDPQVVRRAVDGMEAVVHLGGVADEAGFEVLFGPNIEGTYNVFEAARNAGTRRVVYASSGHVTGFYSVTQRLIGREPVRPDSLYGVSKAFGEALGRMYADKFGLEVVCVRIGAFQKRPSEARHLSTWLSPGDARRLFGACLSAPSPLGYRVVYGVSANTQRWWDLGPARDLGYEPRDDAEAFARDLPLPMDAGVQGGHYAEPDYGGWARQNAANSS